MPFLTPTSRPFIKICGLSSRREADFCMEAGADAIGINFFPGSKRYLPFEKAREWLRDFAGAGFPARVALFVNAGLDEVRRAAESGLFEAVQLHGDESPEYCAAIRAFGLPLIRAVALRAETDIPALSRFSADAFILDAWVPGSYGGTGHRGDWHLAAEAVRRFPSLPLMLSGGLTPENAGVAVMEIAPFGLDVASGVESSPGVKDPEKVRTFVIAARETAAIPD